MDGRAAMLGAVQGRRTRARRGRRGGPEIRGYASPVLAPELEEKYVNPGRLRTEVVSGLGPIHGNAQTWDELVRRARTRNDRRRRSRVRARRRAPRRGHARRALARPRHRRKHEAGEHRRTRTHVRIGSIRSEGERCPPPSAEAEKRVMLKKSGLGLAGPLSASSLANVVAPKYWPNSSMSSL